MGMIDSMDKRLTMMGKMMKATDTDLSEAGITPTSSEFSAMVTRCFNCPSPDSCESWLKEGHEHTQAPGFCPNKQVLNDH